MTGCGRFLPDDFGIVIVHIVHDNRNYLTLAAIVLFVVPPMPMGGFALLGTHFSRAA
jgi:hypothetical protein